MTVLESQNTTNISNGFHDGFGDETFGNQSQSSPLHVHAFNGNKKLLQDALQSKEYGVDDIDSTGRTPLIYSVLVEQIDCFNLLLKHGADIDKPDTDGRTCLHWAAYQGNHKLVKLVLSKCKNRTSRDKEGQTPLHLAISHDNLRVMQIILKHLNEHEVDATDNRGMTALCWSAHYERIEHVELLLRYGSDVHVLDNERRGILHWTSQNKDPVLIKRLLEKGCKGLGFPDQKGRTVLHMAVGQGNQAIIEYLLTISDIPVNQTDEIQRTPLHWAAVLGHTAIVELLLNSGADYSLADNNGVRPLHYAVQNNHRDVVATMIRTGRVTDEPDKDQRTALMWAALKGHMNVLKVLLGGKNVNINAVGINKQTALHMSCQTGNLECVQLLIQHKADVNMMDQQQHTPLFYACASGHGQIVTKLLQQDDQRNLHQCDLEGRTPLHYSAMVDRREIVNNLLQHGLDPNAQDNSGCPPLHIAAYGGNVHCMNVLLENNAQVNMQDNSGSTALHLACRSGNLDAVKLLVSRYRANMNIFDGSEEKLTCLDYAILNDHQDVSFFLTENGANTISTLHDLSLKIQTNWRGYSARKRYAELKRKMNISTSIPKRRLTNLTTTSLGDNTLKVGTLPPVSPTHAVLPHKANSHIGIPTARYRSNTQVSHTSNVSDSRQGPKFIEGNAANPFSLNRVARVKSPGTEMRVPNSSRSKSSTGVMPPYRPNNLPPPKRMNSTGKMGSRNHIFSLSSKSSTTSSSDYFFAKNEKTFIEPKKPPTIHIQPQQPAHDHLIQYEGRTSAVSHLLRKHPFNIDRYLLSRCQTMNSPTSCTKMCNLHHHDASYHNLLHDRAQAPVIQTSKMVATNHGIFIEETKNEYTSFD
uniref:Ankyrin repeat protein Diego n=1 Tax=Clytia hemisphaerica TaxID=252671 RepID=I1YAQ9_9CNID|nr:ankyrin repeat protein Diego [Clytia hemisphaerica]